MNITMHVFSLEREQQWDPRHHVEKILGRIADGDVTVACWGAGPDQPVSLPPSRYRDLFLLFGWRHHEDTKGHCCRHAPGAFVVHPPGEVHEYENGPARTLLFRVRYGSDMGAHHYEWRGNKDWQQSPADADYYRRNLI